jgi:[ribosomal protein S5]-alanine N-acetyltransferase
MTTTPDTIPLLQTERLILRPFCMADAPEVQRLAGDRAIADTTLNIPHPYEDGMAEEWIGTHGEEFAAGRGVTWAVVQKLDRSLVGAIGFITIVARHQAELGYWMGKPYWNSGFCTEAGQSVLRFAFEQLSLVRVHARYLSRNPASGRVMQKLGMRHEGTLRQHGRKWDKLEDLELYGVLREEWTQRRGTCEGGQSLVK